MSQFPTGPYRYKRRSAIKPQLYSVLPKTKIEIIRAVIRRFVGFMGTTSASQKRYLFSALLWASAAVINVTPLRQRPDWAGVSQLALIVWLIAMASDGVRVFDRIKATTIGSLIIWGVGLALGNFLVVSAMQEVAAITGEDPSKFPHTVAMLTLLEVPQLAIVVLIVITVPWVVFGVLGLMHEFSPELKSLWIDKPGTPEHPEPYATPSRILRFVSFTILLIYIGDHWRNGIPGYESWVKQRAEGFLYTFEMYTKSACEAVQGQRHMPISETTALVGTETKGVYSFKSIACKKEPPKKATMVPLSSEQYEVP